MKISVIQSATSLLFATGFSLLSAEDDTHAVMRFQNNDQLAGKLTALGDQTLVWDSDILAEPATFDLKHLLNLTLSADNQAPEASHTAVLTLKNGDVVHGQLKEINDDSIAIDTWFAGPMKFNRLMVSKVQIEGGSSLHFRGPSSLDQWKQSPSDCWQYNRQAFISLKAGSIARDKILPEECTVAFTVERKSDQLDLKLLLFSNDVEESRPGSGYELSFQRSSVYLRSGKTRNFLGSDHSRELSQNDKARIEIRASSITGKVALVINGKVTEVWNDPGVERNEFGTGLHFIAGNNQKMRISDIQVSPWDGQIDQMPQPRGFRGHQNPSIQPKPEEKPEDKQGRMELANGDSLKGKVITIEEGLITLETPLGKIKLPVERLRSLNLEGLDEEEAKKENKDIRAYFADGSSLVFRLDGVEDGHIVGSSQHFSTDSKFGSATFLLSAINRIEFSVWNEELKALRKDNDW